MTTNPAEITARAEPVGLANAGKFACPTGKCVRPIGVRFFYDDPLRTPITDLEVQIADVSGEILLESAQTEALLSRGLEDATPGVGALRPDLGGVVYSEAPFGAGMMVATTNPSEDIQSAADEAWELEKSIVGSLWEFEQTMKRIFTPYVEEWEREGAMGAAGDFVDGVWNGATTWWEGESDFWGSAWGWLKTTTVDVASATWDAVSNPIDTANAVYDAVGNAVSAAIDFIEPLGEVMKAFLFGDIDALFENLQILQALKEFGGAIGEFGEMLVVLFQDGVDVLRDMIETIRRTPLLGLISNTFMRIVTMMTPNFWAKALGEGVGFVIPEVLIWAITAIIAALSAGSASVVLAARCASIAGKIRGAIKGSQHVGNLLKFLDDVWVVIAQIGPLGAKLRKSIEETVEGIADSSRKLFRTSRYWRTKLDDLARQGHGPQRHEGDVTESQLKNRALHKIDPMTGNTVDYDQFYKKYQVEYDPNIHGIPGTSATPVSINVPGKGNIPINWNKVTHKCADHATKINTPADFVRAYEHVLTDPRFKSFVTNGEPVLRLDDVRIFDIFGPNFQSRLRGYSVTGNADIPLTATRFDSNAKLVAIFTKDANGIPVLKTLYPNP